MTLSFKQLSFLVLVIAFCTIAAALGFQYLGGYAPCHLCYYERWSYYFGVPAALIALLLASSRPGLARIVLVLIALAFLANSGLSLYHFGVEQKWWAGPTTCTGGGSSTDWRVLAEQLEHTSVVRCDVAAIKVLGLSLTFWDFVVSVLLTLLAACGAIKGRRA